MVTSAAILMTSHAPVAAAGCTAHACAAAARRGTAAAVAGASETDSPTAKTLHNLTFLFQNIKNSFTSFTDTISNLSNNARITIFVKK